MDIVVASGNKHKLSEIQQVFSTLRLAVNLKLMQGKDIAEPDEPFDTFILNACHKAKYYYKFTKTNTLSEDGGLCIEALDDFPGVRTKDFILECGGRERASLELEKMLAANENRKAYFICAVALYLADRDLMITHESICHGTLSFPARGDSGFGFDPIFIPNGYKETFGQLGVSVKNKIGHRAQAISGIAKQLTAYINIT